MSNLIPVLEQAFIIGTIAFVMIFSIVKLIRIILLMINISSKPLEFDYELKKKIEFICDFCNTKPKIINGNIRNIEHTNLSYIEPHRVIIKGEK